MMRFFAMLLSAVGLFLACGPSYAFDPSVCTREGYLADFEARLSPQPCVLIATYEIRFAGTAVPLNVIRLASDSGGDDSRWTPYVQTLAARVGPQLDAMPGTQIAETTVLLTSLVEETSAHAVARSPEERECKISFYKSSAPVSTEEFTFTYAHELFHCVQSKTWRTRDNFRAAGWWVEGSAEYFAHLVQPGTGFSDGWYAQFDRKSLRDSLLDLQYENVVFFLWLGQSAPSAVKTLIDAMPETEGRAAQLAALRTALPLERWIAFAQDYVDGQIHQPGGRAVARPVAAMERIAVSGPVRVPLTGNEYALARRVLAFEQGATYALTVEEVEHGLRLRMSLSAREWIDPPPRVRACNEAKTYVVLALATDGVGRAVLNVEAPEELDERSCCLIGEWTPTTPSLLDTAQQQNRIGGEMAAAKGVQAPQCAHLGGDWALRFESSGRGAIVWNDYTNECKVTLPKGEMRTRGVWSGTLAFTWTVSRSAPAGEGDRRQSVGHVTYTENTVQNAVTTFFGPRSTRPQTMPLAGPRETAFTYQCSDSELVVNGLYNLHPGATHTPADQR